MLATENGEVRRLELPPAEAQALPGVPWGSFEVFLTPAFWAGRVFLATLAGDHRSYRLGDSLREELAACLLGGHGIPAEVGLAAFRRLRDVGLLSASPSEKETLEALAEPLHVNGRLVRYRFAQQKARYLSACLARLPPEDTLPEDDRACRDQLAELPGLGPKTASWILRNWRDSDQVAIIDVHIWRSCVRSSVFDERWTPARHYLLLEERFLSFAAALGCRPSVLDNVMWREIRGLPVPAPRGMTGDARD